VAKYKIIYRGKVVDSGEWTEEYAYYLFNEYRLAYRGGVKLERIK
jgi:hypothetical protein